MSQGFNGKFIAASCRYSSGASGLAIVIAAAACAAPAAAQIAPTREEVQRTEPQPEANRAPPRLEVEGGIERAPCALDSPEFANIRFTLRDVMFDDLRGVDAAELRSSYAGLVGTEQPVAVLCQIRDRAATILRRQGYIASVEVPEQRIADGTVRFKVLMAKLVQVRVRGDAGRAERTIAGFLGRLTEQPVFNRFDAERYLLLASDLPGYNVRLTLRPAGTVPGEVVGDVTVLRTNAWVDANIQNYGSHAIGRWGGLLRGQLFGLTGLGDRTTATIFSTSDFKEQQTVQLGHDFLLGSEGLAVSGNFTYAWARPDFNDGADILARTLFATAEVSYPFVRTQARTVRGALGFDYVDQDVSINKADLSRDRLRVAFARLNADAISLDFSRQGTSLAEPLWRASGVLELRQGVGIFNATRHCDAAPAVCFPTGTVVPSRVDADGTATVVSGSVYGEYRPAPKWTLSLGMRGQYSADPLLSFEQYSAGNYTVGRGYDPGALLGDRGIGVQAEVRIGSLVPVTGRALAAEPYFFFDYAKVDNDGPRIPGAGSRSLSSAGVGVRATWDRFRLDALLAMPLKKIGPFDEQPDPRILISLSTRLWPWSFE